MPPPQRYETIPDHRLADSRGRRQCRTREGFQSAGLTILLRSSSSEAWRHERAARLPAAVWRCENTLAAPIPPRPAAPVELRNFA